MADEMDPPDLARRYLDLWQDQLSAMAADPAMTKILQGFLVFPGQDSTAAPQNGTWNPETIGLAMAAWGDAVSAALRNAGGPGAQKPGGLEKGRGHDKTAGTAAGATASPAASADGRGDLDELAGRLTALEERIALLERNPGGSKPAKPSARKGTGRASGKPRKRAG